MANSESVETVPDVPRFVGVHEVCTMIGITRPTLWTWRRAGVFPQAVRLGPNRIAWPLEVVLAWRQSRPLAAPRSAADTKTVTP